MDEDGKCLLFCAMTTLVSAAMLAGGHKADAQLLPKALGQVDRIMAEARTRFPNATPVQLQQG